MSPLEKYYASEYHRRNMQVASVIGAKASVDQALERALSVKHIPNWLIAYLKSAANRLPGLEHDLAMWRDLAPDAPDSVHQHPSIDPAAIREAALREAASALTKEADKCEDAAKWGGRRQYVANCKAAAYALRDQADAILALIDKPAPDHFSDAGNMIDKGAG